MVEADVPLTGPRLAASLMWAQGSCELSTAKPRTRRSLAPLRGVFLDHDPLLLSPCGPSSRPQRRVSKPPVRVPVHRNSLITVWSPAHGKSGTLADYYQKKRKA